jgi:hypothetical protein
MTTNPSHVALARNFGWLLILVAAFSLFSGKTYSKSNAPWGMTDRNETPGAYWAAVICYSLPGLFLVIMGWFTSRKYPGRTQGTLIG